MSETAWGIIGPGAIAHNFADGLEECASGRLIAVSGRSPQRRNAFASRYAIPAAKSYSDYAALAKDGDVDAIYIAVPHPFHAEISIACLRAGKPVLCEKPAGMSASQVTTMVEIAEQAGLFFMEGFMYRCHPQIARVLEIIRSGEIGSVRHIRSAFGFNAPFQANTRLYDRVVGGGAILDVGCYPLSLSRLIAGAALGQSFAEPERLVGTGRMGTSGVDEEAYALLSFGSGITAECQVALTRDMNNSATIFAQNGSIHLPDPWIPGRNAGPSDSVIEIEVDGQVRTEDIRRPEHLFAYEAEIASQAISEGRTEAASPAMSWADSIGNAAAMDRWRKQVGYRLTSADPAVNRPLPSLIPPDLPVVPKRMISGVDRPVSVLVMGCDNKNEFLDGAPVWDAWMEAGGNGFDTAFVYGEGRHEAALGEWIAARNVANDVLVIAKGAHTPYCTPDAIGAQLRTSLDRLQLDKVPIYIMHRDNLDVPVGEFVDALNHQRAEGRIGIFGGSNWTLQRFEEANEYARKNGLQELSVLNNNLALASMTGAVWQGCLTSNTPELLEYLRLHNIVHLSWSSQARGYFLPPGLRDRLPADIGPESFFGGPDNEERRKRAELLAHERGVTAHNIAGAWVLAQSFPSFALIGPRSPGELATTLPSLAVAITPGEAAWLNLESDQREA